MKKLIYVFFSFITICNYGQTKNEVQKIISEYDLNNIQELKERLEIENAQKKEEANRLALLNGWNLKINSQDGSFMELQEVIDGKPIYYSIDNISAAKSTRTDHLNAKGSLGLNLMGQNMTAFVWDGGATFPTHVEFDGAGGNNRVTVNDASVVNVNTFHAQHVTGTIVASGLDPRAQGMAPHASARTADWNNDSAEVVAETANGMLISNHSYGISASNSLPDYFFGGYINTSNLWDQIMFNAPNYLMVTSAGNDGNRNLFNGRPLNGNIFYDKLLGSKTSKNNLVVANAQGAIIDSNGNLISVSINSSSSEGPTDDLRIKPDITGNGTDVYSSFHFPSWDERNSNNSRFTPLSDGNINDDYYSIDGTSMATPNVSGSLLLLQQHYNNLNRNFMRASTLKGLALHTADDAGNTGPDAIFGWGLLNAKKAAETITNMGDQSLVEELTLNTGDTYSFNVTSDGVNPLLASISWTDRAGIATRVTNSATPVLVNDLDIRVSKLGTQYEPWMLTGVTTNGQGDNIVDPYERVDISNASGEYTVTVTHKGTLVGASQNYSLIITGITTCEDIISVTNDVDSGEHDRQQAFSLVEAYNVINPNATANYISEGTVVLGDNFHATAGSTFSAFIENCGSSTVSSASSKNLTTTSFESINIEEEDVLSTIKNISITTYPNPSDGLFTIQSPYFIKSYSLHNIVGKQILLKENVNSNTLSIDISAFPSGFYFLEIQNENGEISKEKIIKN